MYCMIVVYCIADGEKSRREGFYAPPSRHRTPLARETREREGSESGRSGKGARAVGAGWRDGGA
jgi:hypothetical protein